MSIIKEIVPNIIQWAEFSEEKQLNFNGHMVCYQGESVIIDPPNLSGEGMEKLKSVIRSV